jgi:hypothetical protein
LHFSCDLDHIGRAWNSLVALFIDMKCEIGMKVTILNSEEWTAGQRGREITVYIYSFHHSYRGYMQGVVPEHDHDLYLGQELLTVYNTPFWYNFIREAEKRLEAIGAVSRGVADGDLALPGCRFASLRNEAYVPVPVPVGSATVSMPIEAESSDSNVDVVDTKGRRGDGPHQEYKHGNAVTSPAHLPSPLPSAAGTW